ncbi:MAG: DsbA family protein [Proteobacteria bacterium]|nr:DsbA family protein [Pseudomonadota bacterium]
MLGAAAFSPARADPDDMAIGAPDAKVTVVEYASITCPYCAEWNRTVFPAFKKKYVDTGQVRFVLREMLVHGDADVAGFLLARCAGPGRYFPVFSTVLEHVPELQASDDPRPVFVHVAADFGLSEKQFDACIADKAGFEGLRQRSRAAIAQHVLGTPTFMVDGHVLQGEQSLEDMDAVLQPLLARPAAALTAAGGQP